MTDLPRVPSLALPIDLRALAERGVLRCVRKGERLIEEGRLGDELYIVLEGRLRAYSRNDKGREITYGLYGPGECVGEMSLDGGARSASVVALQDSRCAMLTRQTLLAYIGERPEFALELVAMVIRRARAATTSVKRLALSDAYERLKLLLESLAAEPVDGACLVTEPLHHRDIAHRIGCSREMVSRLLKDLVSGGYIADRGGRLLLMRPLPMRW